MSMPHPQDKPSTSDLANAGDAASRPEKRPPEKSPPEKSLPEKSLPEKSLMDEPPRNVRRMDPPARRDMDPPARGEMEPRAGAAHETDHASALVPAQEGTELRRRWETIQTGFVDEPRRSVEEADSLVAQTMKRVAEVFAQERTNLERQWSKGQDVSTEDLRVALKRYRSFFDRLLSV